MACRSVKRNEGLGIYIGQLAHWKPSEFSISFSYDNKMEGRARFVLGEAVAHAGRPGILAGGLCCWCRAGLGRGNAHVRVRCRMAWRKNRDCYRKAQPQPPIAYLVRTAWRNLRQSIFARLRKKPDQSRGNRFRFRRFPILSRDQIEGRDQCPLRDCFGHRRQTRCFFPRIDIRPHQCRHHAERHSARFVADGRKQKGVVLRRQGRER
jgi:hypothetical protein